jgi:excisionase family DNA binding protein
MNGNELLTKSQVAAQLKISTRTVERMIRDRQLRAIRIRRVVRIPLAELKNLTRIEEA